MQKSEERPLLESPIKDPEYLRDAERIAADVIVWTWDKVDQEGMLDLRERANALAELVGRARETTGNVESDMHVNIGVRAAELKQLYREQTVRSLDWLVERCAVLHDGAERGIDELVRQLRSAIARGREEEGRGGTDHLLYEALRILGQTNMETSDALQAFLRHMAARPKSAEPPSERMRVFVGMIQDLAASFRIRKKLEQLEQRIVALRDEKSDLQSGIRLRTIEKNVENIRNALARMFVIHEKDMKRVIPTEATPDDISRAKESTERWLTNATTGETLTYFHESVGEDEQQQLERQHGGTDYSDRVVITVTKSAAEQYRLFVSETLGVRSYISGRQPSIFPALQEMLRELEGKTAGQGITLTLPTPADEKMRQTWTNYGHVDGNYRQTQVSIENLTTEITLALTRRLINTIAELHEHQKIDGLSLPGNDK